MTGKTYARFVNIVRGFCTQQITASGNAYTFEMENEKTTDATSTSVYTIIINIVGCCCALVKIGGVHKERWPCARADVVELLITENVVCAMTKTRARRCDGMDAPRTTNTKKLRASVDPRRPSSPTDRRHAESAATCRATARDPVVEQRVLTAKPSGRLLATQRWRYRRSVGRDQHDNIIISLSYKSW